MKQMLSFHIGLKVVTVSSASNLLCI